MNGPDFIGIGVQRGGTSWLYQCFKEHPQIFMPSKEVHFFDQYYERGVNWYNSLFKVNSEEKVSGEITPDYIFKKDALKRIKEHYPKIKLILILREPFERAYSAVGLLKSKKRYQNASFEEVIEKEPWVIEQSLYHKQLAYLFDLFPKEQVLIFRFEDIADRPLWLLQTVFKFIGVDEKFKPKVFNEKFNIAGTYKVSNIFNLEKIQTKLNKNIVGRTILKIKKLKIIKSLKHRLSDSRISTRQKSIECPENIILKFKDDIIKTEELLGINLDSWYEP